MLTNILTGKQTVQQAAKSTSNKITYDPQRKQLSAAGDARWRLNRFPFTQAQMPPEQPQGSSGGIAVSGEPASPRRRCRMR